VRRALRAFGPLPALAIAGVLLALLVLAAPAARASELEDTLLRLAERALAEGDLRTARSRYERALALRPGSPAAHGGLGAVALREGDEPAALRHFEAALANEPATRAARLGMAEILERRGERAAAAAQLQAGLAHAPLDAELHERLFAVTGLAPPGGPDDPSAVRARAAAHPYDPRAQLALARLLVARGDAAAARVALETALLVADLAPEVAPEAAGVLAGLAGEDARRRFVPVHVWADQTVRAQPGWSFELRIAWGRAAAGLAPVLETTFVPVALHEFSSEDAGDDLVSIQQAMLAKIERSPLEGIVAGFTRRASPRTASDSRLGQASYLGRELVVRMDPADEQGRTLAHEVLHLYGAIHVSPEIPSLMNPMGGAWTLDPYNAALLAITRERRFGPGSVERNVLERVDEAALADALVAALGVNVALRNAGLREAMEEARTSRVAAALAAREAIGQDPHLADVSRLTAAVLLRRERAAEAVTMMENAARLYGPATPAGRAAQAEADRWRAAYKRFLR